MFSGRVAVIIGGDNPIALACADAFATLEAKVALVGSAPTAALDRLLNCWLPGQMACWICHGAEPDMVAACLDSIEQIWARPTVLVNCMIDDNQASRIENERGLIFAHHFLANVEAPAALASMLTIMPPASRTSESGNRSTKLREMRELVEYLAVRWANQRISINLIQPGELDVGQAGPDDVAARGALTKVTSADVAWLATMLAAPAARNVTGTVIHVDGGVSLAERELRRN